MAKELDYHITLNISIDDEKEADSLEAGIELNSNLLTDWDIADNSDTMEEDETDYNAIFSIEFSNTIDLGKFMYALKLNGYEL
jgi:hypothetical protein